MSQAHPSQETIAMSATPVSRPGARVARPVGPRDVAPNYRRGGDLRVLLGPATVGATGGFMGILTLAPGQFVAEHLHPYSEEFLYVVSGAVLARLDGEQMAVAQGEGLFVPIGIRHRVANPNAVPAVVTFHLCPLAPRPELGHVDTEEPTAAHPSAGM
jgi:putative monooxygenase